MKAPLGGTHRKALPAPLAILAGVSMLLAEPVDLPVYDDLWLADASKETLLGIWQNVIGTAGIDIRTGQKVVDVKRESWGFHVVTPDASWPARHVILAMGRRGSPRKAEVPGEELPKVFYDVVEMEEFAGRRVLVVGGGDSAVESAIGLARQRGTTVHLSYRGEAFSRIKERNREKLEEAVKSGTLRTLLRSTLLEIREDAVRLDVAGETVVPPNDDVIVRIGGEPPTAFLDRIGVRRVVKELAGAWLLAIGLSTEAVTMISFRLFRYGFFTTRNGFYFASHSAASLTDCWSNFMRKRTKGPSAV